uniref:Uncharacterized protein n=1 Tax=Romanomermis culicivorax TaxID=13658 RepID=A0A915K4L8_ROMCU
MYKTLKNYDKMVVQPDSSSWRYVDILYRDNPEAVEIVPSLRSSTSCQFIQFGALGIGFARLGWPPYPLPNNRMRFISFHGFQKTHFIKKHAIEVEAYSISKSTEE